VVKDYVVRAAEKLDLKNKKVQEYQYLSEPAFLMLMKFIGP
jgi:hypothetical protein